MTLNSLWIFATLLASAAQVIRNTLQKHLTVQLGVLGATQVRFTYGLPCAFLFLTLIVGIGGENVPSLSPTFAAYAAFGALSQIVATALMLKAMSTFSLPLVTAFTKTEPLQVAVFAWAVLGEKLGFAACLAMSVAVFGVALMSYKPTHNTPSKTFSQRELLKAIALGVMAGGFFALAAVGFRGAIVSLEGGSFLLRASTALVAALFIQSTVMISYLAVMNRQALLGSLQTWKASLGAGFMGALASQFWFIGFSLAPAAHVRTLGLVEMLFAVALGYFAFGHRMSGREIIGLIMMLTGLAAFGLSV
jgi:drug/metabolite transporter (DMT)-like permease